MKIISMAIIMVLFLFSFAFAQVVFDSVYVEMGGCKEDGTCVGPHYSSTQDGSRQNDYGPTESYRDRFKPEIRDYDKDGITNVWDCDDDNDLIPDEYDFNQYGETIVCDDFTSQP